MRMVRLIGILLLGLTALSADVPLLAQGVVIHPLVKAHCLACHDVETKEGGLDLSALAFKPDDPQNFAVWVKVHDRVEAGEMPPREETQPSSDQRRGFLAALAPRLVSAAEKANSSKNNETFRRLNRVQYENTLNDLLGTRTELAEMLPRDALGVYGFDRIGSALNLSGEQLQNYMVAAEFALLKALPKQEQLTQPEVKTIVGKPKLNSEGATKAPLPELKPLPEGVVVFKNKIEYGNTRTELAGRYKIRVTHAAYQSTESVYASVKYNGEIIHLLESKPGEPRLTEFETWLPGGKNLSVDPYLDSPYKRPFRSKWHDYSGAGLLVTSMELEGPFYDEWPLRGQTALFGDLKLNKREGSGRYFVEKSVFDREKTTYAVSENPEADARRLIAAFLPKAFRREVTPEEVAKFVKIALEQMKRSGESKFAFHDSMILAYTTILCSPDFLFLQEPKGQLNDHAIASRLSYFLTGSMPDEALFAAAAAGKLRTSEGRIEQAKRLLNSPASDFFIRDFTDQWLDLREIDATVPDPKLYPEFDPVLKAAMVEETRLFFTEILRRDLSLLNFVHSDWTFLNSRLAKHYGIADVAGIDMRKVALPPEGNRGGVLTQAAVLKVTANGSETSPVHRGKWLLERLVGRPPQPPPPNISAIEADVRGTTTIREQLAKHRDVSSCSVCHKALDPHGFALENYDVIGGWRTNYRALMKTGKKIPQVEYRYGPEVQAADILPDGREFKSIEEYKRLLLTDQEQITRSLTQKLLVYALGRELTFADRPLVTSLTTEAKRNDFRFQSLILDLVGRESFAVR